MSSVQYLIGKTLAKYEILEHIGHGGMSEVYKGRQTQLNRMVAVKVLHPFLADEEGFVVRFQREARIVATLRHPNIVQVYDFDHHDELDIYYMVMEYIDGQTLRDLLENGPISPEDTIHVGSAIAEALDYAHQRNMVHRDIKPANIMYLNGTEPVLTDFGIARMLTLSGLTASGAMVGTPAYMAPEIGTGKAGAAASDIYSLSVVLYHAATGNLPFVAETPMGMVLGHISKPPPRPSIFSPDLPEPLERVILRGMEKDPEARFRTAGEMASALRHILNPPTLASAAFSDTEAQPSEPLAPGATVSGHHVKLDQVAQTAHNEDESAEVEEADHELINSSAPAAITASAPDAVGGRRRNSASQPTLHKILRMPTAWLLLVIVTGLTLTGLWYSLVRSADSLAEAVRTVDTVGAVTDAVAPEIPAPATAPTATPAPADNLSTGRQPPAPLLSVAAADCTLRGRIEHVSIEPNKRVAPQASLMAYVTLRNNGTCEWPEGIELRLTGDDAFHIPGYLAVETLDPGEIMQILIPLAAPQDLGTYQTTVEMRDAQGGAFGSPVKLALIVDDLPLQTPLPAVPVTEEAATPQPLAMNAPLLVRWEDQPSEDRWSGIVELAAEGSSGRYRYYQDEIGATTEIVQGRIAVVGRRCESVILNIWVLAENESIYWQGEIPFPAPERCG